MKAMKTASSVAAMASLNPVTNRDATTPKIRALPMEIEIKGKISEDPRDRVLAVEAVTKAICQQTGKDPAEGVMMLLTAAAHLMMTYTRKPAEHNLMALASALGNATVAADDFFKLKSVEVKP
jgi:hypothetical protein